MPLDSILHDRTIFFLRRLMTSFSQDNKGYRNFSRTIIRRPDDTYVLNERMLENVTFKLRRTNLKAL